MGWVIQEWDDIYRALSPSALCTIWQLLGITGGAKFKYNHMPNYLELLREHKLQPQIKTWPVFFIVYQKGDLVKDPIKSRNVVPKNVPGVGWIMQEWGGMGHAGIG